MRELGRRIDGTSIAIFRIGFGIILLWEIIYWLRIDFVKLFLINPKVQLYYEFVSFLKPFPETILNIIVWALLISSCLIILGKFYKGAMIFFFLGFSYIFLLDKAYYNNHLYLICLISFLMIFIPADNKFSLKTKKHKDTHDTYYWNLFVLKLQIALVYFFGGVAKINYDWIVNKQPATTILKAKASTLNMGSILTSDFFVNFIAYGGMIFDLLIGFLLFSPKFRKLAILLAIIFNIMNAWLFNDINIFPYMMIIALILFVDPKEVGKLLKQRNGINNDPAIDNSTVSKKLISAAVIIYFSIQGLLPLRHFLYPGNVEWNGHGQRFAWRMKIQHRFVEKSEFTVWDIENKIIYPVDYRSYKMNQDQINALSYYPKAALQFAKFLKNHSLTNKGIDSVQVKSNIRVSLNGRPIQNIFDKNVDIASLKIRPFIESDWVTPLKELK